MVFYNYEILANYRFTAKGKVVITIFNLDTSTLTDHWVFFSGYGINIFLAFYGECAKLTDVNFFFTHGFRLFILHRWNATKQTSTKAIMNSVGIIPIFLFSDPPLLSPVAFRSSVYSGVVPGKPS
jgi:hypothetical protein